MRTAEVSVRLTFRRNAADPDRFEYYRKRFFAPGQRRVECVIPKQLRAFARAAHPDTIKARETKNEIHIWIGAPVLPERFFENVARAMDRSFDHDPVPPDAPKNMTDCCGESSGTWVSLRPFP